MDQQLFCKRFDMPEFVLPVIDMIFSSQEQDFICTVNSPFRIGDLSVLPTFSGMDEEEIKAFIAEAYHRGIVSYMDDTLAEMKLANFYERMDVMAVSDRDHYLLIPEAMRKDICAWLFDRYYNGLDQSTYPTNDCTMTLEETLAFIDSKGDAPVYLNHCDCKSLNGECGKPNDMCITWKTGINTYFHRGLSTKITPEIAKDVVRRADKAGLMHTVNPTGICSCCGDCCYLFRSVKRRGCEGIWPKAANIISFDDDKCVSCGLCTKRCWFGVLKLDGKKMTVDTSKCVGCGICATTCPKGALQPVPRG